MKNYFYKIFARLYIHRKVAACKERRPTRVVFSCQMEECGPVTSTTLLGVLITLTRTATQNQVLLQVVRSLLKHNDKKLQEPAIQLLTCLVQMLFLQPVQRTCTLTRTSTKLPLTIRSGRVIERAKRLTED